MTAGDVYVTGLPMGVEVDSLDAYQEYAAGIFAVCPEMEWTVEEIVSSGENVAAVVTAAGTHEGELLGIDATGERIEIGGTFFFTLDDGKITRKRNRTDDLRLLQQIGVVPEEI